MLRDNVTESQSSSSGVAFGPPPLDAFERHQRPGRTGVNEEALRAVPVPQYLGDDRRVRFGHAARRGLVDTSQAKDN